MKFLKKTIRDFINEDLKGDKLPLEYPLKKAVKIYLNRFIIMILVTVFSLIICGGYILIINATSN